MSTPRSSLFVNPSRPAFVAGALVAMALLGCKKDDQAGMVGGYQVGQTGGGAGGAFGAPPPATAGGAAPVGAAGAPVAAGGGTSAPPSGPIAQRLDPSAGAAIRPLLDQVAKEQTQPGAKAVGETLVGNFGTGQTLDTQIQLQPNKCYTVVATGLPPVGEVGLQLQLTTALPGMAPVLAVDSDRGSTAVIGKKTQCYRWTLGVIPAPGKVVVQVTAGTGLVAAQVYEK